MANDPKDISADDLRRWCIEDLRPQWVDDWRDLGMTMIGPMVFAVLLLIVLSFLVE